MQMTLLSCLAYDYGRVVQMGPAGNVCTATDWPSSSVHTFRFAAADA